MRRAWLIALLGSGVLAAGARATDASSSLKDKVIVPAAGAKFSGQTADHDPVSFKTSSNAKHVAKFVAAFRYSCTSDPSGKIKLRLSKRSPVNNVTGFFGINEHDALPGLTKSANFSFSGNFSKHGRIAKSAKGSLQISFKDLNGDFCVGDNASWSAHA